MREDIAEMKLAAKETNAILLALNDRFLTIDQAQAMRAERDRALDAHTEDIQALDTRVTKLEAWRSWIAGAVAVVGFGLGLAAEAVRAWRG